MAITNLTGYSWRPNSTFTYPSSTTSYNINYTTSKFVAYNNNYYKTYINLSISNSFLAGTPTSGSLMPFTTSTTWSNVFKYFYITGGTDVTNTTLIAWLQANGTLSTRSNNLGNLLTDIADSIRDGTDSSATINAQNFPEELGTMGAIAKLQNLTTSTSSGTPIVSTAGKVAADLRATAIDIYSPNSLSAVNNFGGTVINVNNGVSGVFNGTIANVNNNSGSTIVSLTNSSSATINTLSNSGTITAATNSGTITSLSNTGTIGDSEIASSATTGKNGLYGTGTVYLAATGEEGISIRSAHKLTSLVLKAGTSSSYTGSYLLNLTIGAYAAINNIDNSVNGNLYTLSNSGTINLLANSGTISKLYNNGGTIRDYYTNDLYTELSTKPQTGTSYNINSGIITNKGGTSSAYGGYIYMINNDAYAKISELNNNNNATIQSINNQGGTVDGLYNIFNGTITALDNAMGGTIATLTNDTEGTITTLNNSGTITKLYNTGTIGDSTASSSSSTGQNGLYGSGTVYVSATGASDPSLSSYGLANITLKGGTPNNQGAYVGQLNINSYATINAINMSSMSVISTLSNSGTISTLTNSSYITTFNNNGSVYYGTNSNLFGTSYTPINNTGSMYLTHLTSGSGFISLKPYGASVSVSAISGGKANFLVNVSTASTLAGYLVAANAGILFKYTGSTTTYGGVTYTNGNVYTYES